MVFTFYNDAGLGTIELKGESFKYLVKVRRHKVGDSLAFRQYKERDILYIYCIESLDGRRATLKLQESRKESIKSEKKLHIGWCLIDPKSIEKVLAQLNESGVDKITFITCKRSQKNFRLDFERFYRILDASSQQCGRSDMMQFATCNSVEEFLQKYPDTAIFDFAGTPLSKTQDIATVLIGCEGGFSQEERQLFVTNRLFRFKTPMVLRSETAVVAVSNKVLL